jgi:pimeloyl-ACP methyl ester carboxylesterase
MSWLIALAFAVAHAAAPFPTTAALTAADGAKIQAVWGAPAKAERAVVLVHGAGRTGEDWSLLADKLFRAGLIVSVVDLRGHGASAAAAPADLTPDHYSAMLKDVQAAVAHVRAQGAKRVALVGADLGANLALTVAADDAEVASVALLSPGLNYKGVVTNDAIRRYGVRPVLFVASRDDTYGATSAQTLDAAALGAHRIELYDTAGKGARMLNRQPELEGALIGFLQASWTASAAPPPADKPTTVDIKLTTEAMKTSGPTELPTGATPSP